MNNGNNLPGEYGEYSYIWNYDEYSKSEQKKKKGRRKGIKVFAVTLSLVLLLSVFTMAFALAFPDLVGSGDGEEKDNGVGGSEGAGGANISYDIPEIGDRQYLTAPEIAAIGLRSTVGIEVTVKRSYGPAGTAVGSGFILTEDGYILTNHHVIENADKIIVTLPDGSKEEAKLVGSVSADDIAVVKIDRTGLTPIDPGNSDDLVPGEMVVAIGTPADIKFIGTVTVGYISALNRSVDITDGRGKVLKTMSVLQTDATLNPGNSGGPLFNSSGQVIGVNTLKVGINEGFEGLGFSIPSNIALPIAFQLIEKGESEGSGIVKARGAIGITPLDITADEAEYYGVPQGVMVEKITRTASSYKAGLRLGDIIIKMNGTTVKTQAELRQMLEDFYAGDEITLVVFRDDKETSVTFKLDAAQ